MDLCTNLVGQSIQCSEVAGMEEVLQYLPEQVVQAVRELRNRQTLEEIRLRVGQPVCVNLSGREWVLKTDGRVLQVDEQMLRQIVNRACSFSGYAVQEQLRSGFLTLPGGHRMGICGCVQSNGTMTHITSINLRIARQIRGFAEPVVAFLQQNPASTLILGEPGSGKTTLLRELVRCMSDHLHWRVCLLDERWELAGTVGGERQYDVGRHTDVLSGVGKQQGVEMVLRGMNPQWIALDEITAMADVTAVERACYCGVRLIATAHGHSVQDFQRRPVYQALWNLGFFENVVTMDENRQARAERRNK